MHVKRKLNIIFLSTHKPEGKLMNILLHLLGAFIPGRLGTSLAACRDNNKNGGRVTRMVNANSSRGIDQVLSFVP